MFMQVFFDPLNKDCKNITGAIKQSERLCFNIFFLQKPREINQGDYPLKTPSMNECVRPNANACLQIYKEGEQLESIPLIQTDYGWTI